MLLLFLNEYDKQQDYGLLQGENKPIATIIFPSEFVLGILLMIKSMLFKWRLIMFVLFLWKEKIFVYWRQQTL